jgi:nicotinamidase-related amidase
VVESPAVQLPDWCAAVPAADVAAFSGGAANLVRPLTVGRRPALIVVDMTRAFVDSRYPTGWSPTGVPAVAANSALLDAARSVGVPVFFTKSWQDPNHVPTPAEWGRWKPSQTAPPDPALGPGDVIVDELTPRAGEVVIHKQLKPSAFFGTPLASLLLYEAVDTVIVTGMTTSGCVRATAVDAFQHNLHVVLAHEACADRSQISHQVSLFDLHMKYADVVSVDQAIDLLAHVSAVTGGRR